MIDCMEPWMGRTAAVVDLGMLKNNLAEIRKKLKPGVELMAVLKGDGYRHGAEGLYPTLKACGVTNYAVALWSEVLPCGSMARQSRFLCLEIPEIMT